jgi:hypothetical protein
MYGCHPSGEVHQPQCASRHRTVSQTTRCCSYLGGLQARTSYHCAFCRVFHASCSVDKVEVKLVKRVVGSHTRAVPASDVSVTDQEATIPCTCSHSSHKGKSSCTPPLNTRNQQASTTRRWKGCRFVQGQRPAAPSRKLHRHRSRLETSLAAARACHRRYTLCSSTCRSATTFTDSALPLLPANYLQPVWSSLVATLASATPHTHTPDRDALLQGPCGLHSHP